jgi:hypothetical protein
MAITDQVLNELLKEYLRLSPVERRECWLFNNSCPRLVSALKKHLTHGRGQAIVWFVFGFTNGWETGGMGVMPRQLRIDYPGTIHHEGVS